MSRMLWIGLGLLWLGTLPLVAQKLGQNPETARAIELFQQVAESGQANNEIEFFDLWIESLEKEMGIEHPQVQLALRTAGVAFYGQGQFRESLRYFEREVKLSKTTLGLEHPETLVSLNNLAQVVTALGDRQTAFRIQEQVLDVRRRILGIEHPDTLVTDSHLAQRLKHWETYKVPNTEKSRCSKLANAF